MSATPQPVRFFIGAAGNIAKVQLLNGTLPLTEANEPGWWSGITRMVLTLGATTIDSDVEATAFDWTTDLATATVHINIGLIVAQEFAGNARLEVYRSAVKTVMVADDAADFGRVPLAVNVSA